MTPKKLSKIKQQLTDLREHPQGVKHGKLVGYAKKLGRTKSNTGKHPTYIRKDANPELAPPLSIPAHPGDMPLGTVQSVVDQLINDVDVWEIHLMEQEKD